MALLQALNIATVRGYRYAGDEYFIRDDGHNDFSTIMKVHHNQVPIGIINEHVAR